MDTKKLILGQVILILIASALLTFKPALIEQTTGSFIFDPQTTGCCELTCTETFSEFCPTENFHANQTCFNTDSCNVGCCIDNEGYCYTNYVKNYCEREGKEFIGSRECGEYRECLIPPKNPADQRGFSYYDRGNILTLTVSPVSGKIGNSFKMSSTVLEPEQIVLNLGNDKFERHILLYDDGLGADLFSSDLIYSNNFISSVHPNIVNITPVFIGLENDDSSYNKTTNLLLSPTDCIPVRRQDHFESYNKTPVVFATNDLAKNLRIWPLNQLNMIFPKNKLDEKYSLYFVDKQIGPEEIMNECHFLSKPYVIYLDKNEEFCTQSEKLITINSNFLPDNRFHSEVIMDDFCRYVTTIVRKVVEIKNKRARPHVDILSPTNDTFISDGATSLVFAAKDNESKFLKYEVYIDNDQGKIAWGYMQANETIELPIYVEDGIHDIMVKVQDMDYNKGGDMIEVRANSANFHIMTSLDDDFEFTGNVEGHFNVSYAFDKILNYHILVDNKLMDFGEMNSTHKTNFSFFIPPGVYDTIIKVDDGAGGRVRTHFSVINVSSRTDTYSSITGSVIERLSPRIDTPYTGAPSSGYLLNETTKNPIYYAVDDEQFYEPVKLCTPTEDTGARYKPGICMNATTSINVTTIMKNYYDNRYYYQYFYYALSCKDDIFVDVFLEDDLGTQQEISSTILDMGYSVIDEDTYIGLGNYSKICVYTSDTDANKTCAYFQPNECNNGEDDDNDGLIDSNDPGCSYPYDDNEGDGTSECQDGIDNDMDGVADAADPACHIGGVMAGEYIPTHNNERSATTQCQDGFDNDGDGLCDFAGCRIDGKDLPPDPGCLTRDDYYEGDGTSECQDGIDNDGNGKIDYPEDFGCTSPTDYHESPSQCFDGLDNDMDGFIDYPDDLGCHSPRDESEDMQIPVCEIYDETIFRNYFAAINETHSNSHYLIYSCMGRVAYEVQINNSGSISVINSGILRYNESTFGDFVLNNNEEICFVASDSESLNRRCYRK